MTTVQIEGPSWDLSGEYSGVDDALIDKDLALASDFMGQMQAINERFGDGDVEQQFTV